jgi:hydroxyacyl-ACP dehydratase HTD2-like protein with hotdog domain
LPEDGVQGRQPVGSSLDATVLAQVGKRSAPQTEVVTRRDIRKYSVATAQRLQRYRDGDEAPPLFHVTLFWPIVRMEELCPDGVAPDDMFPQIPGRRPMAGGLKIEYQRPIRPGDVLTATRTLSRIYERQGSAGTLVFVEVLMTVTDANGALVLTEEATRIMR